MTSHPGDKVDCLLEVKLLPNKRCENREWADSGRSDGLLGSVYLESAFCEPFGMRLFVVGIHFLKNTFNKVRFGM